jgi:protein-tyrosine phosphatase
MHNDYDSQLKAIRLVKTSVITAKSLIFFRFSKKLPINLLNSYQLMDRSSIIRSARFDDLSEDDIEYLKNINVTDVLSFRSGKHAGQASVFEKHNIRFHLLPLPMTWKIPSSGNAHFITAEVYLNSLRNREAIKPILEAISKSSGIVLMGCAYGRDRTGVISMILELLRGDSLIDVAAEYCSSRFFLKDAQFIEEDKKQYFASSEEIVKRFLLGFFKEYGSVENYFYFVGLNDNEISVLRKKALGIKKIDDQIAIFCPEPVYLKEQLAIRLFSEILRFKNEVEFSKAHEELTYSSGDGFACYYSGLEKKYKFSFCNHEISLSQYEIDSLSKEILLFLNNQYAKGSLDFFNIDPIFIERQLGIDIPFIETAEIQTIKLSELRCFSSGNKNGIPIKDGRYYKMLTEGTSLNELPASNHIHETNSERLKTVLSTMKTGMYSKNDQYIVVYNDSNVIRDGEHRCSCLYYLFGDIEVKIMRIKFTQNFFSYKSQGLNFL